MKAIIDGKLYDTEKAELIKTFEQNERKSSMLGIYYKITRKVDLYKTENGKWFLIKHKAEGYGANQDEIEILVKKEVKQIFETLNDVENYEKYFEKLEEA